MKRVLLFAVVVFALGLNFSANAQYDMARTTTDFSLPVSLSAFTATTLGDNVILKWRTESEVNNVGFSIYRSESKVTGTEKMTLVKRSAADYISTNSPREISPL